MLPFFHLIFHKKSQREFSRWHYTMEKLQRTWSELLTSVEHSNQSITALL